MKKRYFTVLMMVVIVVTMALPGFVSAAPAEPFQGKGCFVHDANGAEYLDPDCDFHWVFKYDDAGNLVGLLNYQDHGHLPPGAALPETTLVTILHVDCNCIFDGDYLEIITPNGEYHSQGPITTP